MHPALSNAQNNKIYKSSPLIILSETDSFSQWDAALRALLAKRDLSGHVIHDDPDVDPVFRPIDPVREEGISNSDWNNIWSTHLRAVLTWKNHETEARNIILERLSETVWPRDHIRLSAKALYDSVSSSRRESSSATYIDALKQFHGVKFTSSIEKYCDEFQTAYQNILTAAETLSATDPVPIDRTIPEATAAGFFLVGTIHVSWLSSWRENWAIDTTDRPISLRAMMSSLRTVAANNHQPGFNIPSINSASAASYTKPPIPNARCKKCLHIHKNKDCFKQHPELAVGPRGDRWKENVQKKIESLGIGKAAAEVSDSEDDRQYKEYIDGLLSKESRLNKTDGIAASSVTHNKLPLLYDTGAYCNNEVMRSLRIVTMGVTVNLGGCRIAL